LGVWLGLRLVEKGEEFGLAFIYVGVGGQMGPADAIGCLLVHDSTLLRFRNVSHGGRAFC
jgi:hypothetical protein